MTALSFCRLFVLLQGALEPPNLSEVFSLIVCQNQIASGMHDTEVLSPLFLFIHTGPNCHQGTCVCEQALVEPALFLSHKIMQIPVN
ncbi:hypothetical protein K491DRAFT_20037 [Lophiostoma macrostomum CBS 122681]|uniref:Secreted protein n=1 Tax=Lophiostoma macrostomum CBS 122681 TaxID=1314788 RepID=A0A6A6TNJ1_9PLEO|nr:hypothetical protein K491DRAFT_20037 [Lophiostoma macrostomum CBS 122681]